jgi:hypothetical protein
MSRLTRFGWHDPRKRQYIEGICVESKRVPESHQTTISPSGHYRLDIDRYKQGESLWEYSSGIVTRVADHKIIAEVKRNYGHLWYAWVEHHDGNEYLLCGEDYQGYSVINLTQEIARVYLPEAAERGGGFCWVGVYPSSDTLMLAVEGCYWAWPYEIVFYDFTDPANLPLPEVARIDAADEALGWEDGDTFAVRGFDLRFGHPGPIR